ncbi:MAG: patatin-like phospholipase family protein [Eubacteriaceae bacterium]|jgi:NTE family protein|nr:patatin-like phospholipase family protein [Eubacteriaceae bacterium]
MAEYGLVLSSDGAKSSFEIGAWKALRELNIQISAVSGSFVGALNAALIAQGDFEKAVRFWRNVSAKNLFYVNTTIAQKYTDEWSLTETRQFRRQFVNYVQGKTEELAPLKSLIEEFIDERDVRRSKTKMGFVSISVMNMEAEMITLNKIPRGKLTSFLLAAACFPQIAQVNRAQDPQFSAEYSPYWIIQYAGVDKILSTDDVLVIPPSLKPEVELIRASEAMEFTLNEPVEKMRNNIKIGYLDTLRMFEKSIGSHFFIKQGASVEFDSFREKLGAPLPAHLNELLRLLLGINAVDKQSVEARLSALLAEAGYKGADCYIPLLENIARFIGVKNDEKFVPDKLLSATVSECRKKMGIAKNSLLSASELKDTLSNIAEPGKSTPDSMLFMKYFLLLISAKPSKYDKFQSFLSYLHPKTTAALATLLYLTYA